MTPQSTAREVRRSLQKHDGIRALKMTLQARDHLHTLLTSPAWTSTDTNDHPLLVKSLLLSDDEVRASTPEWLSRHGVYAAERDLVTA